MTKNSRLTIGLLTYGAEDPNSRPLWEGMCAVAQERGVNLLCFPGKPLRSHKGFDAQANILYDLINTENVGGLVSWGTRLATDVGIAEVKTFYERFKPLPIVNIGMKLESVPSLFVDNYQGMHEVMDHLIEFHGYRRIAFIRGPKDNPEAQERYRAYNETLTQYGIPFDPSFVADGDWGRESGATAISLLLDERKANVEAVVADNDMVALGAMKALQARGVQVPQDMAVAGFDDARESRYSTPPLTTVRQSFYEYGKQATKMLLALLEGQEIPEPGILPVNRIVRQSCGCPQLEVEQARAGLTARAISVPKMALAVSRESTRFAMLKAFPDTSVDVISDELDRVLNAFYSELKGAAPGTFLLALDQALRQMGLTGSDVFAWQEAISIMRRTILPYFNDDQTFFRVEDLWQQAQVMIGERMQRVQGHLRTQAEQRTATLDGISQALVSTSDEKELMAILTEGLPKLGILSCYVSRYENPVVPTEWCQNILAYKDGCLVNMEKDKQRFLSWQLVPTNLLPQDKPYSLVVEPLYFQENQIGIAVFEGGPREGAVYETLRGQLSSALWGARLVQYLRSLYEASSIVISLQEPQAILQDVVERACKAVGAKWANIILVDKEGRPQRLAIGGHRNSAFDTSTLISNTPVLIENMQTETSLLYQQMAQKGAEAAGCFPLQLRGKSIGSLWIFYEKLHRFSNAEVDALRLYANQAAIAYDNARRMQELENLRQVSEKLASVAEVQEVLKQIVQSVREVLQADSAVIWSYDAARMVFLPDELVAEGVDPETLERFRENEPSHDGTAAAVFERGYLAVTNVNNAEYAFLGPRARGLRDAINVRSFQGITLQADGEQLGVLYVNYKSPQIFDEGDKSSLEAFAYHAALALKKARLLEQVRRVNDTARVVAKMSAVEELHHTLLAVVKGTQDTMSCDAVLLFIYNKGLEKLEHPPIMAGVLHPEIAASAGEVLKESLVYKMMGQDKPYIVDVIDQDPLFRERRFAKEEHIESCVAIPLQVSGQQVGVMFVNYRKRHRFTGEELADIGLFADQAAVAIRDAQLYKEKVKRVQTLQAVYEAGKIITSTLALDKILEHIVKQASLLTKYAGGGQARFCYLALKENGKLRFKATYSPTLASNSPQRSFIIDLERDKPIGIVGRAVKMGLSQLVNDVATDPDYRIDDPGTRSELAVPIKIGKDVIGVIDVEHSSIGAFDQEDQLALEALAAQAAIAIENARLFDETERRALLLTTAAEVARDTTAILDVKQLLSRTVKLISERFGFYHAGIFLVDDGREYAMLMAASSEAGQHMLKQEHKLKVGKVGMVGFVAGTGKPRIALNVDDDNVFFDNPRLPDTHSEIALPMRAHSQLIGVLDVQSTAPYAFSEDDATVLQSMADQLAIAFENARHFEDLKQIKSFIGTHTALEWMRMVSTVWGHSIKREIGKALVCVELVRQACKKEDYLKALKELDDLEATVFGIGKIPITAPLSAEDAVSSVSINRIVQGYLFTQWNHAQYKSVNLEIKLQPDLDDRVTVRASEEWLRRGLEIVVENAVQAMLNADSHNKRLLVTTLLVKDKVEILIYDTGPGMPNEVTEHFKRGEPIEKPKGSRGAGVGLVLARNIFDAYQGSLKVRETNSLGTVMAITLPIENKEL